MRLSTLAAPMASMARHVETLALAVPLSDAMEFAFSSPVLDQSALQWSTRSPPPNSPGRSPTC
jgi:hypothetical protein